MRTAVLVGTTLLLIAGVSAVADDAGFRDCDGCPVMVPLPGGSYLMGTAVADRVTDPRTGKPATNDGPQHSVTVGEFAIGQYEVTVDDFRAFVDATGYQTVDRCMDFSPEASFKISEEVNWDNPGFDQAGNEPVGCVSFFDAQAYARWLSEQTGEAYRLPTEAEWEYAARAGSTTNYFWGNDPTEVCGYANVRSTGAQTISKRQAASDVEDGFPCDDGYADSSPAGNYAANEFGLYDMQGNAWEWVLDCNHKNYAGAPTDGSAWLDVEECQFGVMRGGSFLNLVERSSATVRAGRPRSGGATNMGFRVARGGTVPVTAPGGPTTAFGAGAVEAGDSAGARLFAENCAACHGESSGYQGVYGTDQESVEIAIRFGGNNVMSMPAFDDLLSDAEIAELASYIREINGWD